MAKLGSESLAEIPTEVGPYRIEGRLGAGGMGAVYRAYDGRLDRPVALKQIHPAADDRESARARFRREARAAAKLSHASIVQVHDLLEDEQTGDWIVMELVEGRTLRSLLTSGPLDPSLAVRLGLQILQGLGAAHHQGLLHRDLKAENVMVDASGQVKILDFGLAKNFDADSRDTTLTAEGKILGTVTAMSPEQALGRPLDARSDLFALGSLLYEMVTGDGPFRAESPVQTLTRIVTQRQPPASTLEPGVPEELSRLIDRLLEKEPTRRPSAEEIERELQSMLGSEMLSSIGGVALPSFESAAQGVTVFDLSEGPGGAAGEPTVDESAGITLADGPAIGSEGRFPPTAGDDSMISGVRIDPWASGLDPRSHDTAAPAHTLPTGSPPLDETYPRSAVRTGLTQTPTGEAVPGSVVAPPPPMEPRTGWRRERWLVVALVLALAVTGWLLSTQLLSTRTVSSPAGTVLSGAPVANLEAPRPSLALLGFRNTSNDAGTEWLSTAFSEMLGTELAAGESLLVISGESVARMQRDLGLDTASSLALDTLARVRRHLDADYVLVGSFLALGEGSSRQVRFDVHIQETATGERVASATESASELDLFDLATRIGGELRFDLDLGDPTTSQASAVRATMSSDPEAYRLYALGLSELRADNALRARDHLRQALDIDDGFALAHATQAKVLRRLGYDKEGEEHALRAFELRSGLPRESVLRIEAEYYEAAARNEDAVRTYSALWSFFPDNLDYGLSLAEAQLSTGEATMAQETLDQLRGMPGGVGDDPRIDLVGAQIANQLSDFQEQLAAATRAAAKGKERGATHLEAKALGTRGAALFQMGELDSAAELLLHSHELNKSLGQLREAGINLNALANLQAARGRMGEAEVSYREALDIFRRTGNRKWTSTILNNFAHLLNNRGELTTAHRMLQESLDLALETGDRSREALRRDSLGWVLLRLGELDEAREQGEESLAIARAIDRPYTAAWALTLLGEIAYDQGDPSAAAEHLSEADTICRDIDYPNLRGPILSRLARVRLLQGDRSAARGLLDQAIAIDRELEANAELARHRLDEARWALATGDATEAAEIAREAGTALEAEGLADDHLRALAVELEARIGTTGDSAAPGLDELVRTVETASVASQAAASRLEAKLALAHLAAFRGDPTAARTLTESVRDEARQRGLGRLVFEARARLLAPELALDSPGTDQARQLLATEAREAGFTLLAEQLGGTV